MIGQLLQLVPLLGAALGVGWLTAWIRRWPALGWALLGLFALLAWEWQELPALTSLAGLSIYPGDALVAALGINLLLDVGKLKGALRGHTMALGFFAALVALSLLRGMLTTPLGTVVTEARSLIYLIVAVGWAIAQADHPWFQAWLWRYMFWIGWGLVAIAIYHIVRYGLGSAEGGQILVNGQYVTNRPIVAGQAGFLGLVALGLVAMRSHRLLTFAALLVVVIAQHRTAWAAVAAGAVALFLQATPKVRANLMVWGIYAVGVAVLLLELGVFESTVADLTQSFQSRTTLTGRDEGWRALVSQLNRQGAWSQFVGDPFGSGWERVEQGMLVAFNPHDWYVAQYLRTGILGVAAIAVIFLGAARRLFADKSRAREFAWLVMLMVYAIPYNIEWYLAPFLAAALIASRMQSIAMPQESDPLPSGRDEDVGPHTVPSVALFCHGSQ